jgi:hypothetical protein
VAPVSVAEAALPMVSIGCPADAALLEPTYSYLSAYCSAAFAPTLAERLNVAIYELLCNALTYGSAAGEVRFELHRCGQGARLTVANHADANQRARLERQVERVQQDARAVFSSEMERFNSGSSQPSMLGIVRVAHESRLAVELQVSGDRVLVSTECTS